MVTINKGDRYLTEKQDPPPLPGDRQGERVCVQLRTEEEKKTNVYFFFYTDGRFNDHQIFRKDAFFYIDGVHNR